MGCGFTANLLIVTTDVLLSGISTEEAQSPSMPLCTSGVIDNWYFMATSVIVLTLVGGLITDKLVEPRWASGKAVVMKSCRR